MIDNSEKFGLNHFLGSLLDVQPRKVIELLSKIYETDELIVLYSTKASGRDFRIKFGSEPILTMEWKKSKVFDCKVLYPPQKVLGHGIYNVKSVDYEKKLSTTFKFDCSSPDAIEDFVNLIERVVLDITQNTKAKEFEQEESKMLSSNYNNEQPLNRILFGAAGTGKTYHTINHAIAIIDDKPELLDKSLIQTDEERKALKARFDQYIQQGRIKFVTFHQSFSYEDFVEGIRAESVEEKNTEGEYLKYLDYPIVPGVFKQICDQAKEDRSLNDELGVRTNASIWKLSMGDESTRNYCFEHNEMRVGWGQTGDLTQEHTKDSEDYKQFSTTDHHTLEQFVSNVQIGDVVLCLKGVNEINAVGVVTGEYNFNSEHPDAVREDYLHCRKVNWILKNIAFNIRDLNGGVGLTLKTMYKLWRFNWNDLSEKLREEGYHFAINPTKGSKEPYVLIIDEINRGNISRIFGELITLIEDSKRQGADEELSVTLPYSKKEFVVPNNIYIIGTMNSSDRSLTGLDMALRRRFTFVEMPPNPELLKQVKVDGLNIGELLEKINHRIEVLLDRDHCIGHAYFMPLEKEPKIELLADIFQQKIIPLLQEYFFDDWAKINLVLFNNGMLQSKSIQNGLFPSSSEEELSYLEQKKIWCVNPKVFNNIETYRAILGAGSTSNG